MPDLRYHVISLISVFIALALGILLGVAMADRGVISDRVDAELTNIERQIDRQQREIGRLRERTSSDEALLQRVSDTMISDSLVGDDVAVVTGPYADADVADSIQTALTDAGANFTVDAVPAPTDPQELTGFESTTGTTTALTESYAAFAREVMGATDPLADPPESVVFVGGGDIPEDAPSGTRRALEEAQAEMMGVWLDAGMRVVGAEASGRGRSEVPLFQSAGVPSQDNADTPAGRAGVIRLLETEEDGSYGTKETAQEPFPSES